MFTELKMVYQLSDSSFLYNSEKPHRPYIDPGQILSEYPFQPFITEFYKLID